MDTTITLINNESPSDSTINTTPNELTNHYKEITGDIYFYGLSVIIPFGLIGNIFSICVFLASETLRRTTTGQFLIALAISDSTVLIGEMIRWLSFQRNMPGEDQYYLPTKLGLNFLHTSDAACKLTYFLRYAANLWSVWITIAIAAERLIAVAWPLKIGYISTTGRTRAVIVLIIVVGSSLGLFPFWTVGIKNQKCKISDAYHTWNNIVVKFFTLLIPGILIIILTIAIISLLYYASIQRKSSLTRSVKKNCKIGSRLKLSMETQLTIMLVAVCVATIALRAPYTVAYYHRNIVWEMRRHNITVDEVTEKQTYVASKVTDMINTINYAINFILYCFCGSLFRNQVKKMLCIRRNGSAESSNFIATEELALSETRNAKKTFVDEERS